MLHSGESLHYSFKANPTPLWRLPQLKEGVEHDCYIYAWNSAGTVEGVDIVMVRNTLLLVRLGV